MANDVSSKLLKVIRSLNQANLFSNVDAKRA